MCLVGDLRVYLQLMRISLRSQMQYRLSFLMLALGHLLGTFIDFALILILFDRFGSLREWRLEDVAVLYGLVNVSFALAEALGRSFDTFSRLIRSGEFDRILLRPRGAALQVAGRECDLLRVGRLSQGLAVLLWGCASLNVVWTLPKVVLVLVAIGGGTCLFLGIFVLQATACFWTIEPVEVFNAITYGGVQAAQFPLTVYQRWFRWLFTFVVPLGAVTYFPSLRIVERVDPLGSAPWFQAVAPVIGVAFLVVSLRVWRFGVRHYTSAGS